VTATTIAAPAETHRWSAEQHPEWCCQIGCGGVHIAAPDAIPTTHPAGDEVLVAAETGTGDPLIHLVVPTATGCVEVKFTPADALALAAAITAQVRTCTVEAAWVARDVDAYLSWVRQPEAVTR
jgi:hypothetical protein